MTLLHICPLVLLFALICAKGEEITAPIFYPQKSKAKVELPEGLKPLILFLQEAQANDFITSGDASNLKWKLSGVMVIADGIVSVSFDEGHAIVTGVLQLDKPKEEWVVRAESGGSFRHRAFSSLTGRPK